DAVDVGPSVRNGQSRRVDDPGGGRVRTRRVVDEAQREPLVDRATDDVGVRRRGRAGPGGLGSGAHPGCGAQRLQQIPEGRLVDHLGMVEEDGQPGLQGDRLGRGEPDGSVDPRGERHLDELGVIEVLGGEGEIDEVTRAVAGEPTGPELPQRTTQLLLGHAEVIGGVGDADGTVAVEVRDHTEQRGQWHGAGTHRLLTSAAERIETTRTRSSAGPNATASAPWAATNEDSSPRGAVSSRSVPVRPKRVAGSPGRAMARNSAACPSAADTGGSTSGLILDRALSSRASTSAVGGTATVRSVRSTRTSETRISRNVRGSPRSRSCPTTYQCPCRDPVHHGSTLRRVDSTAPGAVCANPSTRPSAMASATTAAAVSSAGSSTDTVVPGSRTGSIPAAVSLVSAPSARAARSPSRQTSEATASTPACSAVSVISGS